MKKLLLLLPFFLHALPTGGSPVSGEAVFASNGSLLEINASDRAIIDWESFSIDAGETARFIQPSPLSCALNRVQGGHVSRIDGLLEANGQIWIVNPNGLIVGKSGKIDAGAFLASTYPIDEDAFATGRELLLEGESPSAIVIEGEIRAKGAVLLAALQIEQSGWIECAKAALAAGKEIVIQTPDNPQIAIRPSKEKLAAEWGIRHQGKTGARNLSFEADGSLYALAINLDGIVEGEVAQIKAEGGSFEQKGKLAASRSIGLNIRSLTLFPEGVLSADAKGEGGGGTLSILAETASLSGSLFARGARPVDPGGKIEIRADSLDLKGTLSAGSPNGSLHIETGSLVFGGAEAPNKIPAKKISALLQSGNSVSIAAKTVIFEEPIVWQGDAALSIRSAEQIQILSLIEQKGNGPISLHTEGTLLIEAGKTPSAVLSQRGSLLLQAKDLLMKGGELPAEIRGGGKTVDLNLSRNWEAPEGAVRVIAQGDASLSIALGGNLLSAASLEIGSQQTLSLQIGGSAKLSQGIVHSEKNCLIEIAGNLALGEGSPLFQSRGGSLQLASRGTLSGGATFLALTDLSLFFGEDIALENCRIKSSIGNAAIRSEKNLAIRKGALESNGNWLRLQGKNLSMEETSLKGANLSLSAETASLSQSRAFAGTDFICSAPLLTLSSAQIESSKTSRFESIEKIVLEKESKIRAGGALFINCGKLDLQSKSEITSLSAAVHANGKISLNDAQWSAQEAFQIAAGSFTAQNSSLIVHSGLLSLAFLIEGSIQNSLIEGKKGIAIESHSLALSQSFVGTREGGIRFAIQEDLNLLEGAFLSSFRNLDADLGSLKMEGAKIKMSLGEMSLRCGRSAHLLESEITTPGNKASLSASRISLDRSKIQGVNHISLSGVEKISIKSSDLQSFKSVRIDSPFSLLEQSGLKAPSIDLEGDRLAIHYGVISALSHLGLKSNELEIYSSTLTSDTTEINKLINSH